MKQIIHKLILFLLLGSFGVVPAGATIFEHAFEECDYTNRDWGMKFSYLNRKFKYTYDRQTMTADVYGNPKKAEHGFVMGVRYSPYFGHGQGLVTGLDCRALFSSLEVDGIDCLMAEVGLYLPLMYRFTLPLSDDFSVFVQTGLGMYLGLVRDLDPMDDDYEDIDVGFGESDDWYNPNQFQLSVPMGFGFTYKALTVEATYNVGLTNNSALITEGKCKESIWEAGISIGF
ncbi:MAG: hypothetical protein K2L32_09420 [Muribaculaceae bacterium]|nr:hypothetical protein [Muribaculaceae bacterium]